jgi:hypothetical protein
MVLKDDLLVGCAAIAAYTGFTQRTIFYLHESGRLPTFRNGGAHLLARKSELDVHLSARGQRERGEDAA